MTRTRQPKPAKPAAVQPADTVDLNDAALDQAAGGGSGQTLSGVDVRPSSGGTGFLKSTDGGRDG